jgi:hypothetical protein
MNLLKASYTGKVGETVGAQWKGKSTVRTYAKHRSHSSIAQLDAFDVHAQLCRFSAGIANSVWPYTNCSDKKTLKHNAVQHWLKPLISSKVFSPGSANQFIKIEPWAYINSVNYSSSTGILTASIACNIFNIRPDDYMSIVGVFLKDGTPLHIQTYNVKDFTLNEFLGRYQVQEVLLWGYTWYRMGRKSYTAGFIYWEGKPMQYSLNEQATGDLWVDGRPIYVRTYQIQGVDPPRRLDIDTDFNGDKILLWAKGVHYFDANSAALIESPPIYDTMSSWVIDQGPGVLSYYPGTNAPTFDHAIITAYYYKQSDTPARLTRAKTKKKK